MHNKYMYCVDKHQAQLFKTKNVISQCMVKTLIIKYGIFANSFAEKTF